MMKPPVVLITGGCGFIGVNLARLLVAEGARVIAYDDLSTGSIEDAAAAGFHDVVVGDVRDGKRLTAAGRHTTSIVHLAARTGVVPSVNDPLDDLSVNVVGTVNALLAARDAGCRSFVFASSNAPLGGADPPAREDRPPRPMSPYGASKAAGEAYCSAFAGSYGMVTTALRFSNVYGPFSYHKGSVIATFFKNVMEGRPLVVYGDGSQTRDFVYVDDLCRGIRAAALSDGGGGIVQLGTATETSIVQLVDLIGQTCDRHLEVRYEPARPGEIHRNFSDISRAREVLGFQPEVDISEGLAQTWTWFLRADESAA